MPPIDFEHIVRQAPTTLSNSVDAGTMSSIPVADGLETSRRGGRSSIDPRALDELERETGDRSVVAVIIDTYLDELDHRLAVIGALEEAIRSGDLALRRAVIRSSHTLKSTAALVGATRLSHLCEQLQVLTTDAPGPKAVAVANSLIIEGKRTAVDLQIVRRRL